MTLNAENFIAVQSFVSNAEIDGDQVLRVVKDPSINIPDGPTYARLKDFEFHNGTIEVEVRSRLLVDDGMGRGFIGVTFRINEDDTAFEALYIRPTNGRCDDQVRRNHSTQYFSYPDYKFDRLRTEFPSLYESYADMALDEWTSMKIEVEGEHAKLYLHGGKHPVLIVNDLKRGDVKGGVALWVDDGSEAFFRNLKITKA